MGQDEESELVRRFLDVYGIQSVEEALRIAHLTLRTMGLSEDDRYTVRFEGLVSREENRRYIREQLEKKGITGK